MPEGKHVLFSFLFLKYITTMTGCWFWLPSIWHFPMNIGLLSSSQLTHIFQRGFSPTTNQIDYPFFFNTPRIDYPFFFEIYNHYEFRWNSPHRPHRNDALTFLTDGGMIHRDEPQFSSISIERWDFPIEINPPAWLWGAPIFGKSPYGKKHQIFFLRVEWGENMDYTDYRTNLIWYLAFSQKLGSILPATYGICSDRGQSVGMYRIPL